MRLARGLRPVTLALVAVAIALGAGAPVMAHDEIESSDPAHQSQFDDPISEVTIEFGEPVDNVELALVGPDDRELPSTSTQLTDTSARLDFEPLADEGEYIVRYLAEEDGHLVAGAITFVYGSRSGAGASVGIWIAFAVVAAIILAVGAFATVRRSQRPADPDAVPTD